MHVLPRECFESRFAQSPKLSIKAELVDPDV
jgi:hypothetical protein